MPRLVPSDPPVRDTGGERVVWEALRAQLPDEAVLFAGVFLQDAAEQREIDLLVAWPGVGLVVVEVKGGHVSVDEDGTWRQGADKHAIDPIGQLRGASHALTELLRRRGLDAGHARIAHVLALPHTPVPRDWESAGLSRAQVLDRDDLARAAGVVKRALDEHGSGHRPLLVEDVDPLVEFLTGAFPSHVEILAEAAEHQDRLDQLTAEQARLAAMFDRYPRLQVVGGAGTGKTWLALEVARRRAREGKRVALLCYSRGLGRYLQRITSEWSARDRPAYVGLFHELAHAWGAPRPEGEPPSDFWEETLPAALRELASATPLEKRFDAIVVDEAQDFGDPWWLSTLACLRDPADGGLFVFLDEEQKVFARDGAAPIDVPPVTLTENLRSTKQIAQLSGALRTDTVTPRGGAGAPVRVVESSFEDAIDRADEVLDALLDEGWEPGRLALLTTGSRHPMQHEVVSHHGYAGYWDEFFAETDVFYGHVLGFKGLERTVVVLAVNGFREGEDEDYARRLLYTGISRARMLLVVVGPRGELERVGGEAVRRRLADAEEWELA